MYLAVLVHSTDLDARWIRKTLKLTARTTTWSYKLCRNRGTSWKSDVIINVSHINKLISKGHGHNFSRIIFFCFYALGIYILNDQMI